MRYTIAALSLCLIAVPALAKPKNEVVVPLKTSTGEDAGTATFQQEKSKLSVKLELKNLPVGEHGVHIHPKALCDPSAATRAISPRTSPTVKVTSATPPSRSTTFRSTPPPPTASSPTGAPPSSST